VFNIYFLKDSCRYRKGFNPPWFPNMQEILEF